MNGKIFEELESFWGTVFRDAISDMIDQIDSLGKREVWITHIISAL